MRKLIIAVLLALACTPAQAYDWGPASLRIAQLVDEKATTEQEAINAIGYLPNKVEMTTCGDKKPWECKILTWGDWPHRLRVYLALTPYSGCADPEKKFCWKSGWYVNHWHVD
jgi:hypothetical protein